MKLNSLPADLLAELAGVTVPATLPSAHGVSFHSARVRPGDAFFALPGAAQHGHAFAEAALEAGAAFIVSDRSHPRGLVVPDPAGLLLALGKRARGALRGPVIGITGSAGKTSSRALVAAALGAQATPGNFNTPLAIAQTLVAAWLGGRTGEGERLVLELGIDSPGEMDALLELTRPTLGVVTLIAPGHLESLGSVDGVAREKLKLLTHPEYAAEHTFISAQAAAFVPLGARRDRLTSYGLARSGTAVTEPDATGIDVSGTVSEVSVEARGYGQTLRACGVRVRLPFVGEALAENAVAALALAAYLGDELNSVARRLEGAQLEPGRLQVHRLGALTLLDDAYNSNPASAGAALSALAHFPRPHAAVLGDMLELGVHAETLHRALGRRSKALDQVIAVGPEMRHLTAENPAARYLEAFDVEAILPLLPTRGTLLVKASRGMRLERLVEVLLARDLSAHHQKADPPARQVDACQVNT